MSAPLRSADRAAALEAAFRALFAHHRASQELGRASVALAAHVRLPNGKTDRAVAALLSDVRDALRAAVIAADVESMRTICDALSALRYPASSRRLTQLRVAVRRLGSDRGLARIPEWKAAADGLLRALADHRRVADRRESRRHFA
ncbi:hypothetical protein [Dokdonella fugitiva]|jgi:hypothetical protein|uniref:Uncharacterized protein n=1 Tax=Dokdonella fugitiva TaxID=328517 RepID=A0A4R2IAL4_9GAMM|nr:hypothetical protein [Dokdonella fugitiva]TCO40438.1 hypothetical protein EV148_105233 [Dokdonella fugitiva]